MSKVTYEKFLVPKLPVQRPTEELDKWPENWYQDTYNKVYVWRKKNIEYFREVPEDILVTIAKLLSEYKHELLVDEKFREYKNNAVSLIKDSIRDSKNLCRDMAKLINNPYLAESTLDSFSKNTWLANSQGVYINHDYPSKTAQVYMTGSNPDAEDLPCSSITDHYLKLQEPIENYQLLISLITAFSQACKHIDAENNPEINSHFEYEDEMRSLLSSIVGALKPYWVGPKYKKRREIWADKLANLLNDVEIKNRKKEKLKLKYVSKLLPDLG